MTRPEKTGEGLPLYQSSHMIIEVINKHMPEHYWTSPELATAKLSDLDYPEENWDSFFERGSHWTRALIIIARGDLLRIERYVQLRLELDEGRTMDGPDENWILFTPEELRARGVNYKEII